MTLHFTISPTAKLSRGPPPEAMQEGTALDSFVCEWKGGHIILVWGQAALQVICKSILLKQKQFVTNLSQIIPVAAPYRVVVFDSNPRSLTAPLIQLYGGLPTLVIDISGVALLELLHIVSASERLLWGFNLPFWSSIVTPIDKDCLTLTTLYQLLHGSKRIASEDFEPLLRQLEEATRRATPEVCGSCFGSLSGGEGARAVGCTHRLCRNCAIFKMGCRHREHKLEVFMIPHTQDEESQPKEANDAIDDATFVCSNGGCEKDSHFDIICQSCWLVTYCSEQCKEDHYEEHSLYCAPGGDSSS